MGGPVSIGLAANDKWQTYKGGVLSLEECPAARPNHAVQIVGVNQDDDENPYWVVRNSWNTRWGEKGYIRLAKGSNVCNIAYQAVGVDVKKMVHNGSSSSGSDDANAMVV